MKFHEIYYHFKPFIPRSLQIYLRRKMVLRKRNSCSNVWPIDEDSGRMPVWWKGWPEGKRFAVILTHDVDTARGQGRCRDLMELEQEAGFRSSFNFVPERYRVSSDIRECLAANGFEVGVHDLYHDGKLYNSRNIFETRAKIINRYLEEWGSVGFRSGSMLCNLEWIHGLNIEYDASTFDTDPFEPNPKGVRTIFPFHVQGSNGQSGFVELPYTLPQDFTLFVLMKEKNIDLWKRKLDWIVEKGGMVLMNTHPDYMSFNRRKLDVEEYPVEYYGKFLELIRNQYDGAYWHVLPRDAAVYIRSINQGGNK